MKVVIFDMDGTLIDSKKDITISINFIRDLHYKLPPLDEQYIVKAINASVRNLPKLFYETEIYEQKDRLLFEEHYLNQCVKNSYLYDGIKQTLEILKENGIKISIATNAPTKFAQTMLEHLGVNNMFDLIIGADKVTHPKPSSLMIDMILDYYCFDKSKDEAWMIGDNDKDILSAKNAGIKSMFAVWGFSEGQKEKNSISRPIDIAKIILEK